MYKISAFRKNAIPTISDEIEDEDSIPGLKVRSPGASQSQKESIMITGQLTDETAFGGEDRGRVIKEAK